MVLSYCRIRQQRKYGTNRKKQRLNRELSYLSEEELKKDPALLVDLLKMMILFHTLDHPDEAKDPIHVPMPAEMGWNLSVAKNPDRLVCVLRIDQKLPALIEEALNEGNCLAAQSLAQKIEADVIGDSDACFE